MNIKKIADKIHDIRNGVGSMVLLSVWLMCLIGMYSTTAVAGLFSIWTSVFCLTTVIIVDRMD